MPLWEMITISCTCGLGGGMIGGLIVAAIACLPRKRRKEPEKNPQNEGETPKKKERAEKDRADPKVQAFAKKQEVRVKDLIDRIYNGENKKTKRSKKE